MLCRVCNQPKTSADFYAGVASRCKECHKAAVKLNRLTNPAVQDYDRKRSKTYQRRAKAAIITKRWRKDHPEAYRAQNAVNNAVRDGHLAKQPCQMCAATDDVHAHHKDYSKPLDVKWLCAKCHHRLHSIFPELGGHYGAVA